MRLLFVDPSHGSGFPIDQFFLLEPQGDFFLGGFDGVRSVADISSDLDAEVSTDGSGSGVLGVGFSEHHSPGFHGV